MQPEHQGTITIAITITTAAVITTTATAKHTYLICRHAQVLANQHHILYYCSEDEFLQCTV